MKYRATMHVPAAQFDKAKAAFHSVVGEDEPLPFDESVIFPNCMMVSVQICPCQEDSCYSQGVLFSRVDNTWVEIGCTDAGDDTFDGEYYLYDGDDEYEVNVVRSLTHEFVTTEHITS